VRRNLFLVCLALFLHPAAGAAQKTTVAAAATAIATTSSVAMLAVAQAVVEDTWMPILDERIQQSPAASPLGAAWTPSDLRWQKARQALGRRMTAVMDRYARSNEVAGHIAAEVGRIGTGSDLDAAVAALSGPAGAALVRQEAKKEFIVNRMTARPGGPKVGTPEWNQQFVDLGRRFDARVGARLPPDDGSHKADLEKLATGPVASTLSRIWMFVVSNAQRQMTTALNLMVFDDQKAIDTDVETAIGATTPAARGGAAAGDTFSLEKMAVCQDSWLDWGADDTRVGAFRDGFRKQFKESAGGDYFVPITRVTLMGMGVARVYASTIGMARGFSVAVNAPFESARKSVEQAIGKALRHCETGDGMRTCSLEIAEKRTVMLMAGTTGTDKTTLVGCFYFYEK
jgi:hypothetical protein